LIGEQVEARLFMDHVEVWYGEEGRRDATAAWAAEGIAWTTDIIDWLVRKPVPSTL